MALLSQASFMVLFFEASLSGVIYQTSLHGVPRPAWVLGVTCRARGSRRWTCRWRAASWERRTQRDVPRPARGSGRCGVSSRSGAETQQTKMCQFFPTIKTCLRMMSAFAFASNIKNGFHGNRLWCSQLTSAFFKNGTVKIKGKKTNAEVRCEWTYLNLKPKQHAVHVK